MVEGIPDEDVEGVGSELADLHRAVAGTQGQGRGAGQIEPVAGEVEQLGIDVDRRLLRSRPCRVQRPGQSTAGGPDVCGPQGLVGEFDVDDASHPVEVLKIQPLRIAESDRRRGDPVDVEHIGIGLTVELLQPSFTR